MRAHFGLPSVENDELEGKPPITVKFEIPYFTVSGIQVCMLWLRLCFIIYNFNECHNSVSYLFQFCSVFTVLWIFKKNQDVIITGLFCL